MKWTTIVSTYVCAYTPVGNRRHKETLYLLLRAEKRETEAILFCWESIPPRGTVKAEPFDLIALVGSR